MSAISQPHGATAPRLDLGRYVRALESAALLGYQGRVAQLVGLAIEVEGLKLPVGAICHIRPEGVPRRVSAEVVGFHDDRLVLMPYGDIEGVRPGSAVLPSRRAFTVPVGAALLGRVLDGLGRPIDGLGPLVGAEQATLGGRRPAALGRARIDTPLQTGVRAIDGFVTCGRGQRIGIFAGSGVGKSTLLGMIARSVRSDVNVIALIGERGREVQEFIERDLGPEGLRRSVVVVSTSDEPALLRLKGAWVATRIAEHFRSQGLDVTFLMDSVTRFAMAQREIGLAAGEPPVTKGYPPSVFALLPRLLERAGTSDRGTITGFYTVLVEGDDTNEPIADTVRSILDGHLWLARELAHQNHYPAIDVLASLSRLMAGLVAPEHQAAASRLRDLLATYRAAKDLVEIGAYAPGSNPEIDRALRLLPQIAALLRQRPDEATPFEETVAALRALAAAAEQ